MINWSLKKITLPLKFTWKISRGEVSQKENYIIEAYEKGDQGLGEVACPTASSIQNEIPNLFEQLAQNDLQSLESLLSLDIPAPLRFGLTSAWTHLRARQKNQEVPAFLNQKKVVPILTSFSVPILREDQIEPYIAEHNLKRFSSLKVKISKKNPTTPCLKIFKLTQKPLRIDANQAFKNVDEVLRWMETIAGVNIELIEQPLPKDLVNESIELKNKSPLPIFGDESITEDVTPEIWTKQFHGINLKLMKSGSYQNLITQRQKAKAAGLKTMLGCMIESSLATSSALNIAQDFDYYDLDSSLFIKRDPFALIHEIDGKIDRKPK